MKPSAIYNTVGQCSNLIQLIYLILVLQGFILKVKCENNAPTTLSNASSRDASRNITKILNEFFSSGYDKRVRPNYGGAPVEVGISMFIISISTVSEVKMDFTSDFYFRQGWNDPRLSFEKQDMISNLYVGAEVAKKIWVPDTFFANEKQAYFHTATTPNRFLRISSDGDVFQSIRLTVTASCPMDLQYFPMDRQSCSIEIESYGYSMADIRYTWSKGKDSVGLSKGLELPQFKVVGHKQEQKEVILSTGNYSRLICDIQFARSLGFYLIQIYIPASLIVVISWVSFWLHRNATPARVALGVTTVLTMTTLMSSTNAQLPKISYIKSIDVFLGTCFVMVFGSLLEYAVVGYLGKRIAMRKSSLEQLSKLAEEHRKKCAAAAAAAAAAANELINSDNNHVNQSHSHQQSNQHHPQQNQQQQTQHNQAQIQAQNQMQHLHHMHPHTQSIQPQLICATTGLPLDPSIQMSCGIKTPIHHQQQMNTNTINNLNNTMNSMNRCVGTQSKMIYGCHQNYRMLDSQQQVQNQAHQTQNTHQMSTQQITKINTKSDQPQNKDASDNQQSFSQSQEQQQTQPQPQQQQTATHLSLPFGPKDPNKMLGVSPSDIDKYSRVVFPVCFVCFNLMYWVIYMHISDVKITGLVPLKS